VYKRQSEYRLIAYDHRGCGQSSLSPPYTFDQLVEDVEGVRLSLDLGRINLAGGSFGGMIALLYALKYPQNLRRLILRGTAASYHHEEQALQNCKARLHKACSASINMCRKLFSADVEDDLELRLIWFALQPLYYEQFDPDAALAKVRQMHVHADTHNALFSIKESYDVRDRLHEIQVPTLVVVGSKDWICPVSESQFIADHIPNARLVVFEGCNHAAHIEDNAKFVQMVREFMSSTP